MNSITAILGSTGGRELTPGVPFYLYRGEQLAIGQLMSVKEDGQLFCMGYAEFNQKWSNDQAFSRWFQSLLGDITDMASEHSSQRHVPDERMRQLQHHLLHLIRILDPKNVLIDTTFRKELCHAAPGCNCSACINAAPKCPCPACIKAAPNCPCSICVNAVSEDISRVFIDDFEDRFFAQCWRR